MYGSGNQLFSLVYLPVRQHRRPDQLERLVALALIYHLTILKKNYNKEEFRVHREREESYEVMIFSK